mmetsp:Transcript_107554/g.213629  ORF Transcript_107554/g.213629 Transcript_107554/m.213629 type:complete len:240 (+) Transcript_107554:124-843(+)
MATRFAAVFAATIVFGQLVASRAATLSARGPIFTSKRKRASLLRKRWDYGEASTESQTEWAIVMRRYMMVDSELNDLEIHLSRALDNPVQGSAIGGVDPFEAASLRGKVEKVSDHLLAASDDQRVNNRTFNDMVHDRKLNSTQRQALEIVHQQQVTTSNRLDAFGQAAVTDAKAVLKELNRASAVQRLQLLRRSSSGTGTHHEATNLPASQTMGQLRTRLSKDIEAFRALRQAPTATNA